MSKPILVVMTRWPASGRCKRRLASTLGCAQAAGIQARLISHTLAVAQDLARDGTLRLHIAVSGAGPRARRRWLASVPEASISTQGRGDLGNRMRREVLRARSVDRTAPVILIGTDLPDLAARDLIRALELLRHSPLVIGPSRDGGYWLFGLGATAPGAPRWPFHSIPWGGDQVFLLTWQRACERGLAPAQLDARNDIDQLEDLEAWLA
ncbi:hypothetical protein MITS9509_00755 [Synechococcus sp. MIT S9509]|uniref:TIGR04282 family arsenosugar biosynthesis glycosyltransferase n=1 Tax=unclassified Synechococcus TaxID=2626047 RepID=UPI0007BC63EA|nr:MULTISPECIES: TIGR04282 family arsenosugar biosynthesis glycosyltransferase [unclassified Synechococcus]KZR86812.1 hypothetical protein MITS9504_00898 [Synechococcus sp. MIT S9504]KZR92882.1 hypothetical protein MITS9509_00755 [Synechococcus sp. MIT S9509]